MPTEVRIQEPVSSICLVYRGPVGASNYGNLKTGLLPVKSLGIDVKESKGGVKDLTARSLQSNLLRYLLYLS